MKKLIHLFSSCEYTRKLWADLARTIKTNTNKEVKFSNTDISLGYQEKQMWPMDILLIILKNIDAYCIQNEETLKLAKALEMLKGIYLEQE